MQAAVCVYLVCECRANMKPAKVLQHASNCDCGGTLPGVQNWKSVSRPSQSSICLHACQHERRPVPLSMLPAEGLPSSAWCCNDCTCWCCVQVVYEHTGCQAACNSCCKKGTGCVITHVSAPTEDELLMQHANVVCEWALLC